MRLRVIVSTLIHIEFRRHIDALDMRNEITNFLHHDSVTLPYTNCAHRCLGQASVTAAHHAFFFYIISYARRQPLSAMDIRQRPQYREAFLGPFDFHVYRDDRPALVVCVTSLSKSLYQDSSELLVYSGDFYIKDCVFRIIRLICHWETSHDWYWYSVLFISWSVFFTEKNQLRSCDLSDWEFKDKSANGVSMPIVQTDVTRPSRYVVLIWL